MTSHSLPPQIAEDKNQATLLSSLFERQPASAQELGVSPISVSESPRCTPVLDYGLAR